jgi:hypothetical protein
MTTSSTSRIRRRSRTQSEPYQDGAVSCPSNFRLFAEDRRIADLKQCKRQLREVTEEHILQVTASVRRFGQALPVVNDARAEIVGGGVVVEAMKRLGYDSVCVVSVDHLSADEVRLLRIALNEIGRRVDWNPNMLGVELKELFEVHPDIHSEVTGFPMVEIDQLINSQSEEEIADSDDQVPSIED